MLLRGCCPLILVLARTLWKSVPSDLQGPIDFGRLLVVSPVPGTVRRVSAATALQRNRFVLEHASEIAVGTLQPGGSLATLLADFTSLPIRVFHELPPIPR